MKRKKPDDSPYAFDISTASSEEVQAEADRRWAKRGGMAILLDETPTVATQFAKIPLAGVEQWRAQISPRTITLAIPFALLSSDNRKYTAIIKRLGKKIWPQIVLNNKYKKTKALIGSVVHAQLPPGWTPWGGRCTLHATIHEPDTSRTRDLTNWAKQVQDSLTGLVYVDDGQLDDVQWTRGAVDPVTPRLILTVNAL